MAHAQPEEVFDQTYGGESIDIFQSVVTTADQGFLLAGLTRSMGAGGFDMYLVMTDSEGEMSWEETYGGRGSDICNQVLSSGDNEFVLAGCTSSAGEGGFDFFLLKVDDEGDVIWENTYGTESRDSCYAVIQTEDGFLLAGNSYGIGAGGSDIFIVKTDENGNEQWRESYGGEQNEVCYSVIQTEDEGFLLAGSTTSFGEGNSDVYLVKIDSEGSLEWDQTYGGAGFDNCFSMVADNDGNLLLTGYTYSFGAGRFDVYLIKIDEDGELIWEQPYGAALDEVGRSVFLSDDGNYFVGGSTFSYGNGGSDLFLMEVDTDGNMSWISTYGGEENDFDNCVIRTDDGFAFTGYSNSQGAGSYDAYLVKVGEVNEPEQKFITYIGYINIYIPFVGPGPTMQISFQGERVAEGETFVVPEYNMADYNLGESFQVFMDGISGMEITFAEGSLREDIEIHLIIKNMLVEGEDPMEFLGFYSPHQRVEELLWLFQDLQVWTEGPDSVQINDDDHFYLNNGSLIEIAFPIDEEFGGMLESLNLDFQRFGAAFWGNQNLQDLGIANFQNDENEWFRVYVSHLSEIVYGEEDAFFDTREAEIVPNWSFISFNVAPTSNDLEDVFQELLVNGNLEFLKDHNGAFWIPSWNISTIRGWNIDRAYQIRLGEGVNHFVTGQAIPEDREINIRQGWALVPYYPQNEMEAEVAFENIRDELIIAKNYLGQFYLPENNHNEFNFNNMDPLAPNKGFQVKLSDEVDFFWGAADNYANFSPQKQPLLSTTHFTYRNQTESNMSLLITSIPEGYDNNELGIFDSNGLCVGGAVLKSGTAVGLAIWGDDTFTNEKDGCLENEKVSFRIWDGQEETLIEPFWLSGSGAYTIDGLNHISLETAQETPDSFRLFPVYPNPFNSVATMKYSLPELTNVTIAIFDLNGRLIQTLINERQTAGFKTVTWNAFDQASGLYLLRIETSDHSAVQKLTLIK